MSHPAEFDNLRVVLVASRNPLNIGAAARAMSNFGFRNLRVVNPYAIAFRDARSAIGAAELLSQAKEYASLAEAIADCVLVVGTTSGGSRELQQQLKPLESAAAEIKASLAIGPAALLFGSEKVGLSNEDLNYCHWLLRIPTRAEHRSMNLGQAVAVCLYELARPENARKQPEGIELAPAGKLDQITAKMMKVLANSGYVKPASDSAAEAKVRRLIRRLNWSSADADLWLGMLRQILWKFEAHTRNPTAQPHPDDERGHER